MDALTLAGTDYTSLAIVTGVGAMVAYALTQVVKVTARAKVQESGGSSKRPWWWAMSLRALSIIFGIVGAELVAILVHVSMGEAAAAGALGGFFCTAIAGVIISQLEKRGIKVANRDTLTMQVEERDDETTLP